MEKKSLKNLDTFERKRHINFFNKILQILPTRYCVTDSNRLTIAFFALSALDLLDAIHKVNSKEIIEWIYTLQVLPNKSRTNSYKCGFRGSPSNGFTSSYNTINDNKDFDYGHIAMTYTGIASLLILGDDLSRLDRQACLDGLKALQLSDGAFKCTIANDSEWDMRFVYCACCISTMLNDFSAIDIDAACSFIKNSMTYDGGFGQGPDEESHGGSTFCACASLKLMGKLDETLTEKEKEKLQFWCLSRQRLGFHGRPHKHDDSCYSFWLGATLKIINSFDLIDFERNKTFVLSTQDEIVGGFGKWPQVIPDIMHSYMGMCGLALMNDFDLLEVNPTLNITNRAVTHMKELHSNWKVNSSSNSSPPKPLNFRTIFIAVLIGLGPAVFPWLWKYFWSKSIR